jgi:hypothetical protein
MNQIDSRTIDLRKEKLTMLSRLISWSGYASILGGLLFGVAVVLHPLRDGLSIENTGVAYGAIHNLGVFGLMLQLFGLVGLYVREADTMGQRGLNSFVVVFFGQVFYICLLVVDGLRNPLLARFAPATVHTFADNDPNQLTIVFLALSLFFVGYIVFGSSLLSAKTMPRVASLLITIGAPIYIIGGINIFIIGPASPIISVIEIVGAVPFAVGYVLLGLNLHSGANVYAGQTSYSS